MFERFRKSSGTGRFGKKTLAAAAFSGVLAGYLVSAGTGANVTGATTAGYVPVVQSVVDAPVATSPFAVLAQKLSGSVVNVKVSKVEKTSSPFADLPDAFRDFFGDRGLRGMPQERSVQGAGSGVIISTDGTILTNNHVVEGAKEVSVTTADKKEYKARVVGRDAKTDLAILKVDAGKDMQAAPMGDSDGLQVGEYVMAVGNPFGLGQTVTSGIVSAKGRVIGAGPYDDFIQTDASINPGNSGGPLFNMKGEIVGINTAIIQHAQGIGFAIPINTARPLIPQLVTKGEVTRGYLGVNIQTVTPELASALKLKDGSGALVADVVPGSPAEKAGIRRGDVIVGYNGKKIQDSHELTIAVAATPVDKAASVTVVRDGREHELSAKIARAASGESGSSESVKPAQGKWGLQLRDLTPQVSRQLGLKAEQGVLVAGVVPGSPADQASLKKGEVILEVDRQPVQSVEEVREKAARAGDSMLLLVQGENGSRYVVLKG